MLEVQTTADSALIVLKLIWTIANKVNQSSIICVPLSFSDHLRRRHARFHQSLKKQVPLKEVFRQAPAPGIPARPDGPRRRQHGNVSILKEDQIVLCVLQLLNLTHRRLWLSAASNHYLSSLGERLQPSRNELIHITKFEELLRSVKNSDWLQFWVEVLKSEKRRDLKEVKCQG